MTGVAAPTLGSDACSRAQPWPIEAVRAAFPTLRRQVRGRPLAYLDNAATAQKPQAVLAAMTDFYQRFNANVQRGVHTLSQEATAAYEAVRDQVAQFLNAPAPSAVVFTGGTTAALNLVAQSYGGLVLRPGDEILLSVLEHHSNIVPWQLVAERVGATIRPIPITDDGDLDLEALGRLLSSRVRIVSVAHVSNVLGTVLPLADIARLVHDAGAVLVVDGAQGVPHLPVDVQELACDFYVFSGHKAFGPTGIGVLYGRPDLLERMPPWQGGGGMIGAVTLERTSYAAPPARFEAGTPPIAEVIGLGAALAHMETWDRGAALGYEHDLLLQASERLSAIPGVRIYGRSAAKQSVVAFTVDGIHPHDVGTALDAVGVAVRAGHHCAQPLMARYGVMAMVRASFAPYNTLAEVDALELGIDRAKAVFGR